MALLLLKVIFKRWDYQKNMSVHFYCIQMAAENLRRDGYVSNKTTKLTARLDITGSGDIKKMVSVVKSIW